MSYSYLMTIDGSFLVTVDHASIVIQADQVSDGDVVPNPPSAVIGDPPPPNAITPAQFSPSGLITVPLTLIEQLPARIPLRPADAATSYSPIDRLSLVEAVLAAIAYPAGTIGCQAMAAVEAVAAASQLAYADDAGYLLWEFAELPAWDGYTCVRGDGRRYWANVIAYPDGAFYWILGGLGGYGLEAYWVFGGLADPTLYVAP